MQTDKWVRVVPMTAWLVPASHHDDAGFGIGEKRVSEGHCDSAASHDHIISFECAVCHLTTFKWNDKSSWLRLLRARSRLRKHDSTIEDVFILSQACDVRVGSRVELSDVSAALVGCGHVSGLSMR